MNYSDLDSIIDYFKSTSSYYLIKKPNNLTIKFWLRDFLILTAILLVGTKYFNLYFLDVSSFMIISILILFFVSAYLFNRKILTKTNDYIDNYNKLYSLDLKTYTQVRFDNFYRFLVANNAHTLNDENFNILITYIKNQEEILTGDPSYNAKKALLTNSILAFIVSASSALTTKFITNNNQLIPFILTSSFIIGIIYTFLTSIIDFPNKVSDEKDTYKYLRIFLYKAKYRYNLEHQKENLNKADACAGLKSLKESVPNINTYEKNIKNSAKTKLHKVIDILFE
jgi:hypothetical protein